MIDTGTGISPADQEVLFQPFQQGAGTESVEGTGLGLTIARRYVELLGGRLSLESAVGRGSRFYFSVALPPAAGPVAADAVASWSRVRHLAPGSAVRALVVDDVEENRRILARMLADIGVEVEVASGGAEALSLLELRLPDVVFLDIRMPVMDGREVLRRIRARPAWNSLQAVAVSASTLAHQLQDLESAGFDAFIGKPFRFEELCAFLADHLQVSYVYDESPEGPPAGGGEEDWSAVLLPTELWARLRQAAELYSVTDLEEHLVEMEQLGGAPQRLAAHLRQLRRQHDMTAILDTLGAVRHG